MSAVGAKELAELLDRHAAPLELYAASWTACPEDCVQEAFIQLAAQRERPKHVVAWLYRVVRNHALNALRTDRRRVEHERAAAIQLQSNVGGSEEPVLQSELATALQTLPSPEREIVVLRIWSELTWQQIGELTDTSSSTAQRWFVAALRKLKERLEPSWALNSIYRQS